MLPFHEPPPGHYNLLEKPFPGFLGSTSSSSPWFPFSPHEEAGLHEFLFSPPPNYTDHHPQPPPDPPAANYNKAVAAINGGATTSTSRPRRSRSPRKDRHSKIFTAQGPRDRRMRLSLEVARRFFDLQDMLAFDKPSKTVQWLLNQAKSAIKEVESISRPNCQQFSCSSNSNSTSSSSKSTESSTYESEDVSTISEPKGKLLTRMANEEKVKEKEKEKAPKRTKRSAVVHLVRRANYTVDPALVRESRAKARARARERTIEKKKKMMIRSVSLIGASNEMLGAPISAATHDQALEESVSDHDLNSSLELVADVDEPCSHTHSTVSERVYGFLAMTTDQPGHVQDLDVSFLHEQWGMHYNTTTDEQVHAKQWFFNNNGSNLFL